MTAATRTFARMFLRRRLAAQPQIHRTRWTRILVSVPCTLLGTLASAAVPTPSASPSSATALMARVIANNATAQHGLLGFTTDSRLDVHAGFYRRTQVERRWFVDQDGILQKTGLQPGSDAPFGNSAGEQKHEPWGPYGGEYHFSSTPCAHCAAGIVEIAFDSELHDQKHGHGTLRVDTDRARVEHETFVPYVLKSPARSGTIDVDFGATTAGWFPRSLFATFAGRVGFFGGSADLSETFAGYRRFTSLAEAVSALEGSSTPAASS